MIYQDNPSDERCLNSQTRLELSMSEACDDPHHDVAGDPCGRVKIFHESIEAGLIDVTWSGDLINELAQGIREDTSLIEGGCKTGDGWLQIN